MEWGDTGALEEESPALCSCESSFRRGVQWPQTGKLEQLLGQLPPASVMRLQARSCTTPQELRLHFDDN